MRKVLKAFIGLILIVVLLGAGGTMYLYTAFPKVSVPADLKLEPNDELRTRGKYLAVNVLGCIDCHSERDWARFSGPLVSGTDGKGGEKFSREMGLPGDIYAANITPAGIGRYTDGELARVITEGVTKEGRALFPLMPYPAYAKLCEKDLHAVMVHVRELAPIESQPAATELDFPMSLIVRTIPSAVTARPACPDPNDQLAHGAYLAGVAGCSDCHTPMEKGQFVAGMELAGGRSFPMPGGGKVHSANITPDEETGLGKWDEKSFVQRFKAMEGRPAPKVEPGAFNTVMPWTLYAGMTEHDLKAIYAYLKTVKPVSNKVERFTK